MKNNIDNLSIFLNYLLTQKCVAHNTFLAYKKDLEQCAVFLKNRDKTWQQAELEDFKEFLKFLSTQKIAARSRARKISALKAFYAWAVHEFSWHNTTEGLIFPKLEKKLPIYLQEEEIEQLLNFVARDTSLLGMRNNVMLSLLYVSGARISELVSIKINALHFDTGFLQLTGKGGRERMVPLPLPIMEVLRNYINNTHPLLLKSRTRAKVRDDGDNYLFPVQYAGVIKPISRQSFWLLLKQWCIKANIKKSISPHSLRHSLATHLLKKGANLRSLQLLLGHEAITTVQIYTHLQTDHLRKVYDKKHPRA